MSRWPEALKHSCDVYFYDVAKRVGIDAIAETARKFGLGKMTGVDLPGENPGTIPDQAWKIGTLGEKWYPGETLVAGIGQGFIQIVALAALPDDGAGGQWRLCGDAALFKRYGASNGASACDPAVDGGQCRPCRCDARPR